MPRVGIPVRRILIRVLLGVVAATWVVAGLVGVYSYANNYWLTRGFPEVKRIRGLHAGRERWIRFYSRALGFATDYLVYLPAGYHSTRRYPVFYLLHGMPGRPQAYARIGKIEPRLDNLVAEHRAQPMILVFPDGRIGGDTFSDSEWANTHTGRYEDYVIDVMHDVDHRFRTLANRHDRVITGYSAGALGALNVTLHHLADFASFELWSGPYSENRAGPFASASPALLARYSPLRYAPSLAPEIARHPLQGFMFAGRSDGDSRKLPQMAAELTAAGARVTWRFYSGGHDWEIWYVHLNQMLVQASLFMREPHAFAPAHRRQGARRHRRTHQSGQSGG